MKKIIIYFLVVLSAYISSCEKNDPKPKPANPAQSNCMGSVWTYSVTVSPPVVAGSIIIVYTIGNGMGSKASDTTLTSSWTKSITINTPLGGGDINYPFYLQVSPVKLTSATTVTMHIYKNGVDATTPGSAPLSGTVTLQTSCQ